MSTEMTSLIYGNRSVSPTLPKDARVSDQRLKEACQDFEALFVGQLFAAMRASVPDDGLLARSSGEKIFQEMLDGEYAKAISRTERFGLSQMLYRQLHRPDGTPGA